MADFPDFPDEGRKRRRRRRSYTDDAWGMAEDADSHDGPSADVEDWASGLVDEEGRREDFLYSENTGGGHAGPTPSGIPSHSRQKIEEFHARRQARGEPPLTATSRADQFRDRLNRQVVPGSGSVERRKNYRASGESSRGGYVRTGPPTLLGVPIDFNNLSPTAAVLLLLIFVLSCSCVALVGYLVLG